MVDNISARVGDIKIPILGCGTAEDPFGSSSPEVVEEAILDAIRIGYRHFDTAAVYQSEKPLGEAISEALRLGLVKSRDELFITSKLWCTDAHQHLVLPALSKTLENLKLEYVDLYLIHWPVSAKPSGEYVFPFPEEDSLPLDMKSVWEAMEKCKELGLTKSIGVSNFSIKKLQTLLATAKIPPAVNEIEMNPLWQQKQMGDFCKEKGIVIIAYSPLGAKGTRWGNPNVMGCQLLKDIAVSKGKSIAQICVRWLYEQGVCLVVKSFNKERMKENADIFGWQLSPEELTNISLLPQFRGCDGQGFLSRFGPFRTLQEFWDEE